MGGVKDSMSKRKLDTNLLFEDLGFELSLVNEVLHYAAYDKPNAYGPRNWMEGGDEFIYELKAARHRHWLALNKGELIDRESKRPHRAHIIACDLFLMKFEGENEKVHHQLFKCSKCDTTEVYKVKADSNIENKCLNCGAKGGLYVPE